MQTKLTIELTKTVHKLKFDQKSGVNFKPTICGLFSEGNI